VNAIAYHDDDPVARRFDWSLWRKVLAFGRPFKRWFALLCMVAIVLAGCEVALPLIIAAVIDEVTIDPANARLGPHMLVFAVVCGANLVCVWLFIYSAGQIATGVGYHIRDVSFRKLQELDFAYFDRRPVGWLMARLTSDCNGLARIMGWALLDAVWGTAMIIGIVIAMLILHWKLALAVLVIVPPLAFICRHYQFRLLISSRAVRKANSHVTAAFNESIMGVRTTKALVRERRNFEEFEQTSTRMYDDSILNSLYAAAFLPLTTTLCAAGVGIALWYGGVQVITGSMTLGTLVAFLSFAGHLANPIQEMARTITLIQGAQASAERIQGLIDTEPAIADSPDVAASTQPEPDAIGRIDFHEVTFGYNPDAPVLRDFTLTVEPGQTIAFVGPTGGGKSTVAALLCRFYEPTRGQVMLDGIDYRQRRIAWLQSKLGIVLQTPHLFSGSIRENIRYGRTDASDDEVAHASRVVNADAFISDLPDGYDTEVGEGGSQLSTGQKQLVALARAILADPQIFVMDEATSSVDTETEQLLQAGIERVLGSRTSFVIAHRLSTIRNADRIVVIDDGRIVEQGSHAELLKRDGRYAELYRQHFVEEHLLSGAG